MNSNVMWELGVRHSLSKRTIMIAREESISKIPSDIKNYVVIPYKNDITGFDNFQIKIKEVLQQIEDNPGRKDSPVFDFLNEEELIRSEIKKKQILGNLNGLLTELLHNLDFAENIKNEKEKSDMIETTILTYRTQAMDHLLTTNYVFANVKYYILIRQISDRMKNVNRRLDLLLLDKRFNVDKEHGKTIKEMSTSLIEIITDAIKQTRSLIKTIEKNQPDFSNPPVVYVKEEHKKFFD